MSETYQGRPCAKGHDGVRLRSNRACVECNKANRRAQYAQNKESEKAQMAKAARLRKAVLRVTYYLTFHEQDFDRNGWHWAGRSPVEY